MLLYLPGSGIRGLEAKGLLSIGFIGVLVELGFRV